MAKGILSVDMQGLDQSILNGYQITAQTRGLAPVTLDAPPDLGNNEGYGPLELLLSSLGGCAAMTVVSGLRKKNNRTVGSVNVALSGELRETPPITFSMIDMKMEFIGTDATPEEIQHAIDLAESKLCPVWALLKGNVEVRTTFSVR